MTNTTTTDMLPTLDTLTEHLAQADTPERLASVVSEGLALIEQAESGTGIITFKAWQAMGTATVRLSIQARGTESKAKVSQSEGHDALAAAGVPGLPAKQTVGRWLRASRVSSDILVEAIDHHGQADGPVSLSKAIDILTWCEARTETAGKTNRGTAKATKAEAEAEQAKREAEQVQAEQAKAERREALAKVRGNKVLGLVTAKDLREATDEQLQATIVACQDTLALREQARQAEAKAKREAERQAKQADRAEAESAKAEAERLVAEAKAEAERLVAEAKAMVAEAKAKAKA